MPQLRHSHTDGMPIACLTSPLHHPISAPFQPQPATAMTTLLIQNATCIATFDHADPRSGAELRNATLFIRDVKSSQRAAEKRRRLASRLMGK